MARPPPAVVSPVSPKLAQATGPAAAGGKSSVERIAELLKDREGLKTTVMRLFKSLSAGSQTLDVQGLARFKVVLVQVLGIPGQVFGDDLMTDYVRFDFDGNGRLEVNEVYKLVKFNLWEHVKALGGTPAQVSVPFKTLAEAGYRTSRELGEGSQAVVKLCTDQSGRERCIKCYRKGKMSVGGIEELKDEFEAMRLVGCQSLAQTFEVFQDADFYYMVNEVYYGGDFATLRQRALQQGVALTEDWWQRLFRQCLRALEFMHQQAMIHCDIKEPNMMLKTENYRSPEVVVVDFGLSKAMGGGETGICGGTPGYIPPETLRTRKWFPGGDVFSLGVVIFQMMTDSTPDPKVRTKVHTRGLFLEGCSSFHDMCQATFTRQPPFQRMPPEFPGLKELTEQMLQKELQHRPRAPQALGHPWIAAGAEDAGSRLNNRRSSNPLVSSHPLATQGITPALLAEFNKLQSDRRGAPAVAEAPRQVPATVRQASPQRPVAAPAAVAPGAPPPPPASGAAAKQTMAPTMQVVPASGATIQATSAGLAVAAAPQPAAAAMSARPSRRSTGSAPQAAPQPTTAAVTAAAPRLSIVPVPQGGQAGVQAPAPPRVSVTAPVAVVRPAGQQLEPPTTTAHAHTAPHTPSRPLEQPLLHGLRPSSAAPRQLSPVPGMAFRVSNVAAQQQQQQTEDMRATPLANPLVREHSFTTAQQCCASTSPRPVSPVHARPGAAVAPERAARAPQPGALPAEGGGLSRQATVTRVHPAAAAGAPANGAWTLQAAAAAAKPAAAATALSATAPPGLVACVARQASLVPGGGQPGAVLGAGPVLSFIAAEQAKAIVVAPAAQEALHNPGCRPLEQGRVRQRLVQQR